MSQAVLPPSILGADASSFQRRLEQLNAASVSKRYEAFVDIAWDAPENQIDHADPRWEIGGDDPLGSSAWYRAQAPATRSALGLDKTARAMKTGVIFENVLQRGLLAFAAELPNRRPEFRYALHEVIEEGQHSLMFQEFIDRSGRDPEPLSWLERRLSRVVVGLGRWFPELFMLFVIGGEEPIDYDQKEALRYRREQLHPLLARIMQIHVTEEARHLCFAHGMLRERVPRLSRWRRMLLAFTAPLLLGFMARLMLEPPGSLIARYRIPASVVAEAYRDNPAHQERVAASLGGVTQLCADLGLLTGRNRWLWRATLGFEPRFSRNP